MTTKYKPVQSDEHKGWYEIPGVSSCLANRKGEIMKKKTGHITKGGNAGRYLKISAYVDGNTEPSLVHVHDLVCRAFWGPPEPGMVVLHGNDKRWDNAADNLSWGTQSQNILDVYARGLRKQVSIEAIVGELAPLYHLSFKGNLEGVWKPRHPAGSDADGSTSGPYPEFTEKRISTSNSIEGAFIGIYPNISSFFEVKKYPHMDFYVYQPAFKGNERVLNPEELTSGRYVWDAMVTGEHAILTPTRMECVGKVRVFNTNRLPTRYAHPYEDTTLDMVSVGPTGIRWKWLERNKQLSNEEYPIYLDW